MKMKGIWKNLLLLIAIVLVMLAFLEIAVRIFYPQNLNYTMFDSILIYRHIPNFETIYARQEFSNEIRFNSKGLRDYEYGYEKPQGSYRILLLGSSFSQALQVPFDKTYENIVERKLKQNDKKYEVINAAVGGWGTAQELFFLRTEGLKYNPDMIILDFSPRDIPENAINQLAAVEGGRLVENIPVRASFAKKSLLICSRYANICSLAQTAILSGFKFGRNDKMLKREDVLLRENSAEFNKSLEETFLLIKKIKEAADSKKIPLVILIIPNKEQVDGAKLNQFMEEYSLTREKVEHDKFQRLARKFASENSISYLDLLPQFRQKNINNSFYFEIDGHWNEKGHQMAAELLYSYLTSNGIIK